MFVVVKRSKLSRISVENQGSSNCFLNITNLFYSRPELLKVENDITSDAENALHDWVTYLQIF
jgi:hypothetical protein